MENKIKIPIPEPVITEAEQHLMAIKTLLKPYLIALTKAERRAILKMSDKTLAFVKKTMVYCKTKPAFVPPYMDVEALETDMAVYRQLLPLLRMARQLSSGLDDTLMQAGAEAYSNSLIFYNSVKQAEKADIPDGRTILGDLKKRFVKDQNNSKHTGGKGQ